MRNIQLINRDIELLKQQFKVQVAQDYSIVVIEKFPLQPNFNRPYSDILLELPGNFPVNTPKLYIQNICKIKHGSTHGYGFFHSYKNTEAHLWNSGWAWLCFQVTWNPSTDGILSFLKKMENEMKNLKADRDDDFHL